MYILSIDTSSAWLCVSLSDNERVVASYCRKKERGHGRFLVPVMQRVLTRGGIAPRCLDGLAAVNGPGSFTGLRIGLATVKGLALALNIPVVLIPSLDVLAAAAARHAAMIMPLIDARRRQVYAALYRVNARGEVKRCSPFLLGEPWQIMQRIPKATAVLGDGVHVLSEEQRQAYSQAVYLPNSFQRPLPHVLARLAYQEHLAGRAIAGAAVSARYLYKNTCAVQPAALQKQAA